MARLARITLPGYPHHVMQRGHNEQTVFESEADYRRYLEWLREYTARFSVDVWAYCLMPNHVHVICVPHAPDSLARAFNSLHMRYAQYFNGKRGNSGRVWRPRFMSCILDAASVLEEVRFIENNPIRKEIVGQASDYTWSSARAHVMGVANPVIFDRFPLTAYFPDWRAFLVAGGDEAVIGRARLRLLTGRPAGDLAFIKRLEDIAGRILEVRPRGRPRKTHQ